MDGVKVSDQLPLRRKIVSDYLADPRVLLSGRGRQKGRAGRRCGCSEGSERDGFADGRRGCEPNEYGKKLEKARKWVDPKASRKVAAQLAP